MTDPKITRGEESCRTQFGEAYMGYMTHVPRYNFLAELIRRRGIIKVLYVHVTLSG
jgi:hypothetical protein